MTSACCHLHPLSSSALQILTKEPGFGTAAAALAACSKAGSRTLPKNVLFMKIRDYFYLMGPENAALCSKSSSATGRKWQICLPQANITLFAPHSSEISLLTLQKHSCTKHHGSSNCLGWELLQFHKLFHKYIRLIKRFC